MIRRKWRKRAKWKTLLLGLVGMVMLTGCTTVRETMGQLQIYGNNELIAQSQDRYSYNSREGEASPEGTQFDFRQFTGKHTLWTVDAPESSQLTLDLNLGIDKGKCKLVHVMPSGDVVKLADAKTDAGVITVELPEGENTIKLIGKKAYGNLKVEFSDTGTAQVFAASGENRAIE
ncbi:hypothetical protein [Saccharibacillus sacchari]|uniref:Uncharacterized protein n=1 Tax=Saccharibacillus sacchari TaxID=456493 RepID=A0ACC6P7K3_9BACL